MFLSRLIAKTANIISILIIIIGCLIIVYFWIRIFMFDTYPVNTGSMYPTIQPGDRIVVNKLIFGARLYKNLDFLQGGKLKALRLKGYRGVNYNDVVVFNCAHPMEFDIRTVYVKRCIGLPGDTIWIRNGQYQNSSVKERVMSKYFTVDNTLFGADSTLQICFPYSYMINPYKPIHLKIITTLWQGTILPIQAIHASLGQYRKRLLSE